MRFLHGMLACMLAGCAMQPTASDPNELDAASAPLWLFTTQTVPPGSTLRIGVEFLPPEQALPSNAAASEAPTVEFLPVHFAPATRDPRTERPSDGLGWDGATKHTWTLSASDLGAIDDYLARETMHFLDDLVREDARRVRKEVRLPFLEWQPTDAQLGPRLWSEEATTAAQEEWVNEHGPGLLQRPLRNLLRRLPIVSDLEVEFDDFRSANVPMSQPYRDSHRAERQFGRMSLRLHVDDASDPVEIVYMKSGVRIGSSQEAGKLSIDWHLTDRLRLELRTRTVYDTLDHGVRADLSYWPSATTSVHLSFGDDLDFLSTSSIYSLFETQMDGTGCLLYAVHVF